MALGHLQQGGSKPILKFQTQKNHLQQVKLKTQNGILLPSLPKMGENLSRKLITIWVEPM